jgi:hypothetical protein
MRIPLFRDIYRSRPHVWTIPSGTVLAFPFEVIDTRASSVSDSRTGWHSAFRDRCFRLGTRHQLISWAADNVIRSVVELSILFNRLSAEQPLEICPSGKRKGVSDQVQLAIWVVLASCVAGLRGGNSRLRIPCE